MLSEKITDLIQNQVNKEYYSAYLYLDFSGFYADKGLDGFAAWYKKQADEEVEHAEKFVKYLEDNGVRPVYETIAKPEMNPVELKDPLVFSLDHEKYVTSLINAIYEEAFNEKDYRTQQFLSWFIDEQGEEEKNAEDNLKKFELFGSDPKGLYELNSAFANRE